METGIQKRRVLINAIISVVQVVVSGGILFVLYRFLLNTIGIEKLGIWSVVLAATSVANIANLGLSASVVKFVAKYLARNEERTVANVIQTSVISIGALMGLVLLIVFPFANWLLGLVIPAAYLKDALSILPYALISLWVMVVASVFQAGLDGYQRIDIRGEILIVNSLLNLLLCLVLVPAHGLMGLAYAHIANAVMSLVGSWVMLKRHLSLLPIFLYKWNRKLFKEMVGYGLNFQVISICLMLCDPITKALLTKFGGLVMTGFYEMASRMIVQVRALLVSANQVLVPTVADLQERNPNIIQSVYRDNYRLMFYIALPFYSIIIALTPLISEIWIGHYETYFVVFSILLAVNLFINTLSVPAYFSYLGIGKLKWNTLGHVIPAVMNVILSFSCGFLFGGIGVVSAWILSSITGSLVIAISYNRIYRIPYSELLPRESMRLAAACFIGVFLALLIYYQFNHTLMITIATIITLISFSIIIITPLWSHPMRRRMMGWIANDLLNKREFAR